MESTTIANTGVVADALAVAARVQTLPLTSQCVSWERSHASIPAMSTGGVRLRTDKGAYGATSFPSSGPSASSPPV
jgi:hypothetical protein